MIGDVFAVPLLYEYVQIKCWEPHLLVHYMTRYLQRDHVVCNMISRYNTRSTPIRRGEKIRRTCRIIDRKCTRFVHAPTSSKLAQVGLAANPILGVLDRFRSQHSFTTWSKLRKGHQRWDVRSSIKYYKLRLEEDVAVDGKADAGI